jgi:hypothetical protein
MTIQSRVATPSSMSPWYHTTPLLTLVTDPPVPTLVSIFIFLYFESRPLSLAICPPPTTPDAMATVAPWRRRGRIESEWYAGVVPQPGPLTGGRDTAHTHTQGTRPHTSSPSIVRPNEPAHTHLPACPIRHPSQRHTRLWQLFEYSDLPWHGQRVGARWE